MSAAAATHGIAPSKARLLVTTPDGNVQVVHLDADRYELGRDRSNALSFPGVQGLSRSHLLLERNQHGWTICDLGSTNGTFINSDRVTEPRQLTSLDRISAGALTILFDPEVSAAPPTTFVEATLHDALDSEPEFYGNRHIRALIRAGREICGQTSLSELFKVIMNLSIEAVEASRGVLITIENGEHHLRAQHGSAFHLSSHVRDLVIGQKRSLIVRDALSDDSLSAAQSIVQAQIRGIIAVPLQTDRNVIGLIYLDSPLFIKEFTKDDLNVLTVLANIAAIRIEQARLAEIEKAEMLHARELEHGALIQRSILPPQGKTFPGRADFELSALMFPAREVGGDLYDYFLIDDEHLAFAVGDVSGKGVPAALFMAVARTLLRATAENQNGPAECFTYMNNTLSANDSGMFVTLFYGVLNTRTGELVFANAGHNHPVIFSRDGQVRELPDRSGPMIGVFAGKKYQSFTTQLAPGDAILVHTDGVTEAIDNNDDFFGEARLHQFVVEHASGSAAELTAQLNDHLNGYANGTPQADDITVLVLRRA